MAKQDKKIGIIYSRDVYDAVPDPLVTLDKRFSTKVVGDLIADLRRKIEAIGGMVCMIDEDDLEQMQAAPAIATSYLWPLLSYVENNTTVIESLERMDKDGLLFNPLDGLRASANKIDTFKTFEKNKIPIPRTLVTDNAQEAMEFIKECICAVTKPEIGSEAMGVLFLEWDSENDQVVTTKQSVKLGVKFDDKKKNINPRFSHHTRGGIVTLNPPFFLQRYVGDESIDHSILKIYVLEGHETSGLRLFKTGPITHEETIISYNDIGRGAYQEIISPHDLPKEAAELACRATDAFGLRSGLVDLIWDQNTSQWLALEINNDDFGKVRDRSERICNGYKDGGIFDWNQRLAEALMRVKK